MRLLFCYTFIKLDFRLPKCYVVSLLFQNFLNWQGKMVALENPRYEHYLNHINISLQKMATTIYDAYVLALEGYAKKDIETLDMVRSLLKGMEIEANRIDNEIVKVLALFDPNATDLRRLISCLKITNELIRIVESARSYVKNIKEAINSNINLSLFDDYVLQLHKSTINSLKHAINSLQNSGLDFEELYIQAKIEESKTDDLCLLLEREILSNPISTKEHLFDFAKILSTFRKLEKSADHAVNIANLMVFVKKGGKIKCH